MNSATRFCLLLALHAGAALGGDWPMWGGTPARNTVCDSGVLPESFDPVRGGPTTLPAGLRNVRWVARLGNMTYGSPVVAGGCVLIGTNNGRPRDPRHKGDRGVLMCFRQDDGELLWQLVVPKLPEGGGLKCDYEYLGMASTPVVEGRRVYVITNRAEVLCLDLNGLADGNDGPFTDEPRYLSEPRRTSIKPGPNGPVVTVTPGEPVEPAPTDADIIWRYDMIGELGVYPEDATSCCPLVVGDAVFVGTGNGIDSRHTPAANARTLIALDKHTGKLLAVDAEDIGPRVFEGQWSSPALADLGERKLVLYGAGDGFCYAFDATPPAGAADRPGKLRTVWSADGNPPEYREIPYEEGSEEGPSQIIATPVFCDGKVFVTIGQDPHDGVGKGCLTSIEAATGKVLWRYTDMARALATPAVADGLVYVGDLAGLLHCVDARTGNRIWAHRVGSPVWASALVADGKVYLGTERGDLWVLAAGRKKNVMAKVQTGQPIYPTPAVADGVLYVANNRWLHAAAATRDAAD